MALAVVAGVVVQHVHPRGAQLRVVALRLFLGPPRPKVPWQGHHHHHHRSQQRVSIMCPIEHQRVGVGVVVAQRAEVLRRAQPSSRMATLATLAAGVNQSNEPPQQQHHCRTVMPCAKPSHKLQQRQWQQRQRQQRLRRRHGWRSRRLVRAFESLHIRHALAPAEISPRRANPPRAAERMHPCQKRHLQALWRQVLPHCKRAAHCRRLTRFLRSAKRCLE
jgi:hypothetical protein